MPFFGIIDKRPLECAFVDNDDLTSASSTSYTFTSMSLGAADEERRIVVCIGITSASTSAPIGVQVGGVSATRVNGGNTPGTSANTEIWQASVPSGLTGNVVVSFSGSVSRIIAIALYRVIPEINIASSDVATDSSAPVNLAHSFDIPANGVVIGVAMTNGNGAVSWSNLDVDVNILTASGPVKFTTASRQYSSDQTALSLSVSIGSPSSVGHATFTVLSP